jgi:hypothetical protein
MSSTKLDTSGVFQSVTIESQATRLSLPPHAIHIRRTGIEFLSPTPLPEWTELTVGLQTPKSASRLKATGIVVGCQGNRHAGYVVSIAFLSLSRQAQERLSSLAVRPTA